MGDNSRWGKKGNKKKSLISWWWKNVYSLGLMTSGLLMMMIVQMDPGSPHLTWSRSRQASTLSKSFFPYGRRTIL
jgi:hypothetical protein